MTNLINSSQRCDTCGSRRGFAQYETNDHCFSCGYHRNKFRIEKVDVNEKKGFELPTRDEVSLEFIEYVTKYGLKDSQCYYNRYFDSAIFPIRNLNNKIACYQSRKLNGREPKWVTISKEEHDWGWKYPYIGLRGTRPVEWIIVEDIVSALALENYGYKSIALLGSKANISLLNLISKLGEDFIVWMDGDSAGDRGAKQLLRYLKLSKNVRQIRTDKDPKEYDEASVMEILKIGGLNYEQNN